MLRLSSPAIPVDEPSLPSVVTDTLLVARAQEDVTAFAPLYEAYFDSVYRYWYHRLGSWEAAEDAASLVFTNALAALPRFRIDNRSGSFRSWLFCIAHNVVANHYRSASLRLLLPLAEAGNVVDAGPSPEEEALTTEASRTVHAVLRQLPPEQRRVLELRLAGLADVEISQVLGRSRGAIRTTQYRAVLRLRALLGLERGEACDA